MSRAFAIVDRTFAILSRLWYSVNAGWWPDNPSLLLPGATPQPLLCASPLQLDRAAKTLTCLGVAQSGSALVLGTRGREFESLHLDQYREIVQIAHDPVLPSVETDGLKGQRPWGPSMRDAVLRHEGDSQSRPKYVSMAKRPRPLGSGRFCFGGTVCRGGAWVVLRWVTWESRTVSGKSSRGALTSSYHRFSYHFP